MQIGLVCRIVDMKNKEVISIKDGCRIGCVNDVEVDMKCAKLVAIIVYGRLKCFGIFGREDDIVIKWDDIQIIGEDTILVNYCRECRPRKKSWIPLIFRGWK